MSAEEIIKELPRLTDAERRLVRQRLLELAAQSEAVDSANRSAVNSAMIIAHMDHADAHRRRRCNLDD